MYTETINTDDVFDDGHSIWFWGSNYNGLFKMEKETGLVQIVTSYPYADLMKGKQFSSLIKVDKNIVLASRFGRAKIAIYNLETCEWTVKMLEDCPIDEKHLNSYFSFCMCISHKEYVYVIGYLCPLIIRMNMKDYKIEYIYEWTKEYIPSNNETIRYLVKGEVKKNKAYLPMGFTNSILELDLDTGHTKVYGIDTAIKCFSQLSVIDDKLWITGRGGECIVICDFDMNTICEIDLNGFCDGQYSDDVLYFKSIELDERVLLFSTKAKYMLWVEKQTKKVSKCLELQEYCMHVEGIYGNKFIVCSGIKVYFISGEENIWHVFDTESKQIIQMEVKVDYRQVWEKRFNKCIRENKFCNLENYISGIKLL